MGHFRRRHYESQNWLPRSIWDAIHAIVSLCCANRYNNDIHGNSRNNRSTIDARQQQQYTIEWKSTQNSSSLPCLYLRQRLCWMCSRTSFLTTNDALHSGTDHPSYFLGMDVNTIISRYISWTFQTSYLFLFGAFGIFYFGSILFFALLYLWFALHHPDCVTSAGVPINEGQDMFSDCFHLSWTTFSTVGYGLIYPATGAESYTVSQVCVGLGVLGSFEAFMGVLYAGFCGAILFGKVLRSQNNAQVFFSDPIVIRYGNEELDNGGRGRSSSTTTTSSRNVRRISEEEGEEMKYERMKEQEGGDDHRDEECGNHDLRSWEVTSRQTSVDDDGGGGDNIPCPSLEFRLVNRLHDISSGEIVEAKLNCVAILDPKLCNDDVLDSVKQNESSAVLTNPNSNNTASSSPPPPQVQINEQTTISEFAKVLEQNESNNIATSRGLAFHSSDSKQPRIFCKLTLDTEEHPFFRRVWFGRHKLDENSPLLTQHARDRVKQCGGYWPPDMNNYKSIKKSLHFRHILVCISGTSNANATSVYAQKVYDLVDVNVGYRFVPMNYHAPDGEIKTDGYLLNAVYEQRGGGAEPFY
ncbi:hypothetical protein ACHAXM_003213 [Skeletonema potamos]